MWLFNKKELKTEDIPPKAIGFIYKITNTSDGMWYIGRKLLTRAATKTIKGKKKKIRKESDWTDYWSSSPKLIETIEKEGKQIMIGGNEAYIALCQKHFIRGQIS